MKCATPDELRRDGLFFLWSQPDLFLNRLKCIDYESNVLVEFHSQFSHALMYVFTIDRTRKMFVFQFLLYRRHFHIIQTARRTNQSTRYQKAA